MSVFHEDIVSLLKRCVKTSEQEFTLASGRKSKVYVDTKIATLSPIGSAIVGQYLTDKLEDRGMCDHAVGGPELGACPIISAIGVIAGLRNFDGLELFYIRKEPKGHGMGGQIVGPSIMPGTKALLIEDVTTTGGSLIKAVKVAREHGLVVDEAWCLVDREEGGVEALARESVTLIPITRLWELH